MVSSYPLVVSSGLRVSASIQNTQPFWEQLCTRTLASATPVAGVDAVLALASASAWVYFGVASFSTEAAGHFRLAFPCYTDPFWDFRPQSAPVAGVYVIRTLPQAAAGVDCVLRALYR